MNHWDLNKKKPATKLSDRENALLVGIVPQLVKESQVMEYLGELEFLALTAGADTLKVFTQKVERPDQRTFIGKGKVEEIKQYIDSHDVDIVIFDDDLTGKQQTNLQETFKRKVIDRSTLILDIFAGRAQTAQAKTQVELAQLQYLLPRLRGMWSHLERQRGGIGMRGPGEKEIETDRRMVKEKIALLKEKLEIIDRQNQTQRKNRDTMVRVSLVGYTNVGKSTIMNLISKSDVFAENKLFATLDTTVRKVVFDNMPFLLSDTVGFIRKLPHHLIESFKSTLDEVRESDILVHVIDVSHPQYEDHIKAVHQTLQELGVKDKPTLMVFNKIDLYREKYYDDYLDPGTKADIEREMQKRLKQFYHTDNVLISAQDSENIPLLKEKLSEMIRNVYHVRYPYIAGKWQ